MNQHWYAVYTKTNCERKVINQLNKKKITSFCAVNNTTIDSRSTRRQQRFALLPCIVFVHITAQQLATINKIKEVASVLFWMGEPAIINTLEIEYLEHFTKNYQNLLVERVEVAHNSLPSINTNQQVDIVGNIVAVAQQQIKLILPSLGFAILANTALNSIDENFLINTKSIQV